LAVVAVTWLLAAPTPLPPDVGSRARNPAPTSSPFSWEGGSEVKIVRVYADAVRDDEFVEIANLGTDAVDIAGWTLTDLEASAAFPAGASIPAGGRVVATKNATAYAEDTLEGASFTYGSGEAPRMEGGALRLADAGDEVLLLSPTGDVLDAYVQSDAGYAGPGWTGPPARDLGRGEVAVRGSLGGATTDTDTAIDWDGVRDHRLGQSQFAFDAVLTALGLMYVPDVLQALKEQHRVLKPGGRAVAAVWGQRDRCGWAELFPIVESRIESEVCPMFFQMGTKDVLAQTFGMAGFSDVTLERLPTKLSFASAEEALGAAFLGGAVALAYAKFDEPTREAVHQDYLASIDAYRNGAGYDVPAEFVVALGWKR